MHRIASYLYTHVDMVQRIYELEVCEKIVACSPSHNCEYVKGGNYCVNKAFRSNVDLYSWGPGELVFL